jgi:predicted nucleic acid-binding protein
MRVVPDTNVLVRAARSGSFAEQVLGVIIAGAHDLLLSPFLLSEVARVLRHHRIQARHGLDEAGIDAFVRQLQTAALLVHPDPSDIVAVVTSDPDDDLARAAAVVGNAQVICTRDTHFNEASVQAYCHQHSIRVLSDSELLQELSIG